MQSELTSRYLVLPRPVDDGAAGPSAEYDYAQGLSSLDGEQDGRPFGIECAKNGDLLLPDDRSAGKAAARRMGRNPRCARVHPTDVQLPRSSRTCRGSGPTCSTLALRRLNISVRWPTAFTFHSKSSATINSSYATRYAYRHLKWMGCYP